MAYLKNFSTESIDFQRKSPLYESIIDSVKKIKDIPDKTFKLKSKEVGEIIGEIERSIKKHTNLTIDFIIVDTTWPNAAMVMPHINKNNPVIAELFGIKPKGLTKGDTSALEMVKGGVNLKNSFVSGIYSELTGKLFTTVGLFRHEYLGGEFTAEEVSAMILHEIGHMFTYFEYMGITLTTNFILQNAAYEALELKTVESKHALIKEIKKHLNFDIKDKDAFMNAEKASEIQLIILKDILEEKESETDSKTPDRVNWESLSDQFASRHGAGKDLVTGLDKLYRTFGSSVYLSKGNNLTLNIISFIAFSITGVLTLGILPLIIFGVHFHDEKTAGTYDTDYERLARIRRDVVSHLKVKNLSKEEKSILVERIEDIDNVLKFMRDNKGVITLFMEYLTPSGRKNRKQKEFQTELEKLTNNDLYVLSTKLEIA